MKAVNHTLVWTETWDDDDNSIWEANGPYGDEEGGCLGSWRLVQRLRNNHVAWFEDHDPELLDYDTNDIGHSNLELLKKIIEVQHQDVIESYES